MEFDLTTALPILERTPAVLRVLLEGLPDAWVRATEGEGTWSAFDVVGHLVHGEHTDWIPRARIILAQGADRRFAPFDRFAQERESAGKTMDELLHEFAAARAASLETLRGWALTEAQLSLEGVHPAFGVVTLRQLLSTWVTHDLSHLSQITRVMARQHADAVGPWRQYLQILHR